MSNASLLAIFARYPEPGRVKTRLAADVGDRPACALYKGMVHRILSTADRWAERSGRRVRVFSTSAPDSRWHHWLGDDRDIRPQRGTDLGERMHNALADALEEGFDRAMCIGTDLPGLTREQLDCADDALARNDVVAGPSRDGGYYLIGLRRPAPELFQGIQWSTGEVFSATRAAADKSGLSFSAIESLNDIDTTDDLWGAAGPVSVIIPALNESDIIADAVHRVRLLGPAEIIVADGGSSDGTREKAENAGARVVESEPGRGTQCNAGAAAAGGDTLWFLHADCRPEPLAVWDIGQALSNDEVVGGAFELGLDRSTLWLKIIEKTANWRSHLWGKPYGDQGLFVRGNVFRRIGGFPDWPLMEDVELARRLRRAGRVTIVPRPVLASARRWLRGGVLRTYMTMKLTQWGYLLGAAPESLARFYERGQIQG